MVSVINLLEQKNHYLEKFYALNEQEQAHFFNGNFENLENFYQSRERILETLQYLDQQLQSETVKVVEGELNSSSAEQKKEMKTLLAIKDEYVKRIVKQDLEILAAIDSAKSTIIKELTEMRKHRRAVGKYKSPTFVQRLDEQV